MKYALCLLPVVIGLLIAAGVTGELSLTMLVGGLLVAWGAIGAYFVGATWERRWRGLIDEAQEGDPRERQQPRLGSSG
jgi:Flp pilus assembly pilin Flp